MATVVTITSNGRLMKPQFLNEDKNLQDWTSSNTTIGSSNRYGITDDWEKVLVPVRNDKKE